MTQPLNHLLTNLRSTIFNTLPSNPKNLRTGTKYLRRRLKGPSLLRYHPSRISLQRLNMDHESNKYAGWQGLSASGSTSSEMVNGREDDGAAAEAVEKDAGNIDDSGDAACTGEGSGKERNTRARASGNAGAQLRWEEAVEPGWKEVPRVEGSGWIDDAAERLRRAEVATRKAAGRGAPKKGQGKRSQMKKR